MKAFDTVSHNGLKVKLYDPGITGKMWNLLDKMCCIEHISINDCINGTLDEIRAMSSACTGHPTLRSTMIAPFPDFEIMFISSSM
jgi:hypothetical protein